MTGRACKESIPSASPPVPYPATTAWARHVPSPIAIAALAHDLTRLLEQKLEPFLRLRVLPLTTVTVVIHDQAAEGLPGNTTLSKLIATAKKEYAGGSRV